MKQQNLRILRIPAVCQKLGVTKPTIYRWIKAGSFPKPLQVGPQAVGWREDVVDQFILSRPESANLMT